jgi:hypothetical protein
MVIFDIDLVINFVKDTLQDIESVSILRHSHFTDSKYFCILGITKIGNYTDMFKYYVDYDVINREVNLSFMENIKSVNL